MYLLFHGCFFFHSAFAVSLLSNTTLTSLSLESNSIDGSACIVLSEYLLETVHPLVELNLNSNNITSIGARSMLRILARGVNIKSLSFKGEYGKYVGYCFLFCCIPFI